MTMSTTGITKQNGRAATRGSSSLAQSLRTVKKMAASQAPQTSSPTGFATSSGRFGCVRAVPAPQLTPTTNRISSSCGAQQAASRRRRSRAFQQTDVC